jgi:DNA replication and repair protein RecF
MRLLAVSLRDFRSYQDVRVALGAGLTVISGPNGAGKTNLLEAIYFGCTGRSCRTNNEREVVRFSTGAARVVVEAEGEDGLHEFAVGFVPGQPKRMRVDGAAVERMLDVEQRPLISVFLPDRLELVKGTPSLRRAHLDQFITAMWPARAGTRRAYARTLAQRNALISRIRSGLSAPESLATWDRQLAAHGIALMNDRAAAVGGLSDAFARIAANLGIEGEAAVVYKPRSRAASAEELVAEMSERRQGDIDRGFTGHGPHRDDVALLRDGRELRNYGSQGQQRLALLSLLLAEREALAASRRSTPLMLLDDVMSELDRDRREALVELLRAGRGQSIITTTDLEHVPAAHEDDIARLSVAAGRVREEAIA